MEQRVEDLKQKKEELNEIREEYAAYDLFMRCTHSNGIAYDIIKKRLPVINAEVAKGQWEFQIFGRGSQNCADQMWVARYLLLRAAEGYGVDVDFHCKPFKGDWNGSGMHCNFSTKKLREEGGKEYFEALMAAFEKNCEAHIAAYGPDNHLRLTGLHETQSIDKFTNLRWWFKKGTSNVIH